MKHVTFSYTDTKSYKKAIKKSKNKKYTSQLIQIFTASTNRDEIQSILDDIASSFPKALVIGATTAGEISHAKMYDNSTVISLSLFEETSLLCAHVESMNSLSGKKLASQITSKETKAAIVISEGLRGEDYDGFIKGIKSKNSKLIIAGGLAGDNFVLAKTYVFLNQKIFSSGAVSVSFSGKNLFADNRYNLNWTPIGKEFTITSVEGNIVHTIDNRSAKEIFSRYLGSNIFDKNAAELPNFQLLYTEGNTSVSRTPLGVQGESLVFAGPLKEGQKVQFGFSNATALLSGAEKINQEIDKNPAQAIYIFSCIARKTLLGKTLEKEFHAFEEIAPTAGFFTYGEYYSTSGNNAILNCTTTLLVLSEKKKKKKKAPKRKRVDTHTTDNVTFGALTHFIKQTSDELSENISLLNQYKNVVDKSSLVSKTDVNGKITYVNDNFCKTSKFSREELIGENHNIVRDENISDAIFKKMWFDLNRAKVWRGLISNKAKDGSIYYIETTIMPILDEKGDPQEFIAIRQDVTKQIHSKQRIIEKEQFIKAIFDNQDSVVILASKTDGMLNVNKQLFNFFAYKDFEDFKDQNSCVCNLFIEEEGYIHKNTTPEWIDEIANNPDSDYKVKMLIKDGTVHIFSIIISKIEDKYIINLSDITKLETALLKAHSSEQAKSIFLSNMSHEIRTPLNGILGFTDILVKKNLDKDSAHYVEIIKKSGQTLLNVVNDILDFSKIESGKLSIDETESDLFIEMEAAISTFTSLSKNKGLDYSVYIDPKIPKTLLCDVQRIKQVLNNLINNAMKFTPKHGSVGVNISLQSISSTKASIKFSIKDTGIGIAKEKLPTIFKAFSQADNSISREFGGTGLGLAISNQYLNMMGTTIIVESREGEGSEFSFTLELEVVNAQESLVQNSFDSSIHINILSSKSKKDICSINDIVSSYLNSWNYKYTVIYSLEELHQDATILIVCSKLFDKEACLKTLNNLHCPQLLYIESIEDNFQCRDEKFHPVSQPMTGSTLFDKLRTLSTGLVHQTKQTVIENIAKYKGKVLIAEDNETNQLLITIMLEKRGVEYKLANNGQEVLDEIAQNDIYDLILMDINMPVLDGVSTTKELRANAYTKPIVSLSANVIKSDAIAFKKAGVDETLNKPLVPQELDKILQIYLKAQEEVSFDTINIQKISQELSLLDAKTILKLLRSFARSAKSILLKLQTQALDKDLIHSLKGMSGNLRFNNLYQLTIRLEKIDKEQLEIHKPLLVSHISNLIQQVELLD